MTGCARSSACRDDSEPRGAMTRTRRHVRAWMSGAGRSGRIRSVYTSCARDQRNRCEIASAHARRSYAVHQKLLEFQDLKQTCAATKKVMEEGPSCSLTPL